MISNRRFSRLRLRDFIGDLELAELRDWEFMDRLWLGEAHGFTQWLRLQGDPEVLRSLAIDLERFPEDSSRAVLDAIGLPLRRGMSRAQIVSLLGEPHNTLSFVADRETYEFRVAGDGTYDVSCTVLKQGGLTYLQVMTAL